MSMYKRCTNSYLCRERFAVRVWRIETIAKARGLLLSPPPCAWTLAFGPSNACPWTVTWPRVGRFRRGLSRDILGAIRRMLDCTMPLSLTLRCCAICSARGLHISTQHRPVRIGVESVRCDDYARVVIADEAAATASCAHSRSTELSDVNKKP